MPTEKRDMPTRWEYDLLKNRFVVRKNPLPPPVPGIFDAPYACVKINLSWVSHIMGALEVLKQLDSWSGDEDTQYYADQEVEKLFAALSDPCSAEPDPMTNPIFQFTESCGMEVSYDEGVSWTPVTGWAEFSEACFKGEDGEDGQDGAQGPTGPQGPQGPKGDAGDCDCDETVPPNPNFDPEGDNDGLYCAISIRLADELKKWYDALMDQAGTLSVGVVTGGLTVLAAVSTIFGVVGWGVAIAFNAAVFQLIEKFAEFTTGFTKDMFDEEMIERVRCHLYCILKRRNSAEITLDVMREWATEIQKTEWFMTALTGNLLDMILDGTPIEGWQWVAWATPAVDPRACDCECWEPCSIEYHTDFTLGANGWTLATMHPHTLPSFPTTDNDLKNAYNGGVWAGNKFTTSSAVTSSNRPVVIIEKVFDAEPFTLCSLRAEARGRGAANQDWTQNTRHIFVWVQEAGATELTYLGLQLWGISRPNPAIFEQTADNLLIERVVICGYNGGSYIDLTAVTLNKDIVEEDIED